MNYLGINSTEMKPVAKELNTLLADYHVYYQNLRNFHWNIKGENFFDLHEQFETLYNDARLEIDEIAERILTLRFKPMSLMSAYLSESSIAEAKTNLQAHDMVETLLENHQKVILSLRRVIRAADDAGDEGTIDLAGGFLRNLEKKSWMLDAWLANKREAVVA